MTTETRLLRGRRYPMYQVVDPDWERPTTFCSGPTAAGHCPLTPNGHRVPCAGGELVMLGSDLGRRWSCLIPVGETECPVPALRGRMISQ